jgi:hypothetical protein
MERNNSMTARSWLSAGWATFRKDPVRLASVGLLWFVWGLWLNMEAAGFKEVHDFANPQSLGAFFVPLFLLTILSVGYCFYCLKLVRGPDAPFGLILHGFSRWAAAIVSMILYGLIVGLGVILLVVPGIIWGLKYSLTPYALMDRKLGPWKALKLSGTITTGYKGQLFCTGLVSMIPMIIAAFGTNFYFQTAISLIADCLFWPWMCCSFAVAYDRLSKEADRIGELTGEQLTKALSVPPDVKRDILSGQYSDTEIMIKYAIGATELEEIRKTLDGKV